MKYDDASWHYGGNFPKGLSRKNGATHIAFFLVWALDRGLAGDIHLEDSLKQLELLRQRKISPVQYLIKCCDEKLTNEDLNDLGNAFAAEYYEKTYTNDYAKVFEDDAETVYHVADSWQNFERLKPILDARFDRWSAENTE